MDIYMVGEAAIELGLTNQGVLARIKRGQIAAIKRGGVWTIPRPELNRFKKNRLGISSNLLCLPSQNSSRPRFFMLEGVGLKD